MTIKRIQSYLKEYSYLKSIHSLLHWDMETMMPGGAIEDRAERLSYIQGKIHAHITSKSYEGLIREAEAGKLKPIEKKLLKEIRHDFELNCKLPEAHVKMLSHAQTLATHAWAEARQKNDWKTFRPHLQKLIELKRKETSYLGGKKPYDALIALHDKEFSSEQISKLFRELRDGLGELASRVKKQKTFSEVKDLKAPFPVEAQKEISLFVARLCGLPESHSRLDVSAHPFSINISPRDQRITTRYSVKNLDSLSSTMHEVGHALYEFNLPREWEGTPLQEAVSLSVHESQSRFWENVVGRSREFCAFLHPEMKRLFPKSMKGIDKEKLFHVFNKSVPGLIRVESSELYYNFHIIIRFEIEEQLFNHKLNADDLPALWNEKYKSYLGLKVPNDKNGILQDSHWAGAAFGYFPTYTLGNLISGSLYQRMKKDLPTFKKNLSSGKLSPIGSWLKDSIHVKGRSITAKDLVGELSTRDYLGYLAEKFGV